MAILVVSKGAGCVILCDTTGYWRQTADERLGDPPPERWIQEPLVVRDKDGRPPRGPSGTCKGLYVNH